MIFHARRDFRILNALENSSARYTAAEVEAVVTPLKQRIAELEARLTTD
jgi:hypothetical protein